MHLYFDTSVLGKFFQTFAKVVLVFSNYLVIFLQSKVNLVSILQILVTYIGVIIKQLCFCKSKVTSKFVGSQIQFYSPSFIQLKLSLKSIFKFSPFY